MAIAGHTYDLDAQRVEEGLQGLSPQPIYEHLCPAWISTASSAGSDQGLIADGGPDAQPSLV